MSRSKGYHYSQRVSIKRLMHGPLLGIIRRLFDQAGLHQKYHEPAPSPQQIHSMLEEACEKIEKPSRLVWLSVCLAGRRGEQADLLLIEACLVTENQAGKREKLYTICGTPKGFLRVVNGG